MEEYIIDHDQLPQTNVFRNYFVRLSRYQTQKKQKEQIESINICKEYLFDNPLTQFNELLEYSISDFVSTCGDISDYEKLFSDDNSCNGCFSNIIENRFDSLNLQNEMTFPKLIKFYEFVFTVLSIL